MKDIESWKLTFKSELEINVFLFQTEIVAFEIKMAQLCIKEMHSFRNNDGIVLNLNSRCHTYLCIWFTQIDIKQDYGSKP